MVVRHLGPGGRDRPQQRRLTGIGHSQQTDIGQHLQLQSKQPLLPRSTIGGSTRGAVGTTLEAGIPDPVIPPLRYLEPLLMTQHLPNELTGFIVIDDGPDRNGHINIFPLVAGFFPPHAVLPALSPMHPL